MTPSLRLNAPVTPRPAYLWFLVWPQGFITHHCSRWREQVYQKVCDGDMKRWRAFYRRGARVVRCKVTVATRSADRD
jgi:hypothetical protein